MIVIGAGIAGVSAAAALAASRRVLLLERETQPGYHTTGRSAALLTPFYGNEAVRRLNLAGAAFYREPPAGFSDGPLLAPRGVLVLAERAPRYTQRLYRLADLTALGAELAERVIAAEEAIYAAADDPLVNWDEETLRAAGAAAGLAVTVTAEDETAPTPITPALLVRWFTPAAAGARPSYADHLARQLTPDEAARVRDLFQRQLTGEQVAWASRTLLLVARRD